MLKGWIRNFTLLGRCVKIIIIATKQKEDKLVGRVFKADSAALCLIKVFQAGYTPLY